MGVFVEVKATQLEFFEKKLFVCQYLEEVIVHGGSERKTETEQRQS